MYSDDETDYVPIASTLPAKAQAQTQRPAKKRKVARVKNSWVYEPAISSASAYWDSSLNLARVLEKPDYCERVAEEGIILVADEHAKHTEGDEAPRKATSTEAIHTEGDEAPSGS